MRLLSIVAALWFVGGMSAAAAQTITEYRIPNAIEQPHSIVAGPDGNMWFVGNREVGRVTIEGTFTEFKLPVSGPEDFPTTGFAHGIAAGPDGNLWFTADNVVRITPQGAMTEFRLGTDARPRGIVTGTDGNIWFAENGANKIGRITPQGGITEFPIASDLGRPYGITAAPDGNIWFTTEGTFENVVGRITPLGTITTYKIPTPSPAAHGIAADAAGNLWFTEYQQNKIGRMTPDGVFSEFDVASPSSSARPENIILGPDGAMWFTVFVSNTIGRITSDGTISEYNVPTAGSGPEGIAVGPDGNIWFTEGASGNRIGKLLLSPDGMHLGPVFSSTQPGGRSYIRIHNRGTSNGTATITLSDPTTGVALTSWVSPAIPANAELEFDVATIENAASSNFVKPGYYETSVTASMSGYVRHIFSR